MRKKKIFYKSNTLLNRLWGVYFQTVVQSLAIVSILGSEPLKLSF